MAFIVETLNKRMASSTCLSVAYGDKLIFASASDIRIIASSCLMLNKLYRTVIGIAVLTFVFISESKDRTLARISTKCEDNFSAASGLNLGAHFLHKTGYTFCNN
jgi:hypothetical protein